MTEVDVIAQLGGKLGGTFALGMFAGGWLMHAANVRIIDPYRNRAHTAEIQGMKDRIASLETHIKDLEKFRTDYMAILEAHSNPTLHPAGPRRDV